MKAFTLIELLVSVAIVGILAGFAVANYDEYRRNAYYAHSISQARNALTAANIFISEFKGPYNQVFGYSYANGNFLVNFGDGVSSPERTKYTSSISAFLPGFTPVRDMYLYIEINPNLPPYGFFTVVRSFHCKDKLSATMVRSVQCSSINGKCDTGSPMHRGGGDCPA